MPSFSSCSAARMPSHVDATLMRLRSLPMPCCWYQPISLCAFSMLPFVSKESRASTSVDTRPGTIFRMRVPNSTASRSSALVIVCSREPPCAFAHLSASSTTSAYSGICAAAVMSDGFVVASRDGVTGVDLSVYSGPMSDTQVECLWDSDVRHVIVGTQELGIAQQQMEMAIAHGMTVDAYVYLVWDADVHAQVRTAVDFARRYPVGMLWLDVEQAPDGRSRRELDALIRDGLDACG